MVFLDFSATAQADFLDWLHAGHQRGLMQIAALTPDDLPGLSKMMRKVADRPMDLADASLVWLANKTGLTDVITIDRADFSVYRTASRKPFRNLFDQGGFKGDVAREPGAVYGVGKEGASAAAVNVVTARAAPRRARAHASLRPQSGGVVDGRSAPASLAERGAQAASNTRSR